jgi:hypothetical protein
MKNKFFIIFISLLVTTLCTNSQSIHENNRENYYNKISFFSNNHLIAKQKPGINNQHELGCFASENIQLGEVIIKIPKKFSICPYNLFPFKYELISYLLEIPGMKESVGQNQKLSIFLNTYYILYYLYAPKEEIKSYIENKRLKRYFNIDEIDESLRDSFQENYFEFTQEHLMLLKSLGYPFSMDAELENIFSFVKDKINSSPHVDMILPWAVNFKNFKKAFNILMSRGITIKYEDYKILKSEDTKKNIEVNKLIGKNLGSICLISYIDLCNHYQPKYEDMRDKKNIVITTSKDYINIQPENNYYLGQEVTYTFVNDPSNLVMFYRYGKAIHPNIFNLVKIKVEHKERFNNFQFDLCKELGCVESSIREPSKLPKIKEYALRYPSMEASLINYARVKFYNDSNQDVKFVLKQFYNKEMFSYENEISAWTFYYSSVLDSFTDRNQQKTNYDELLEEIQKYRNMQRLQPISIEENKLKIFEDIYTMDLSYKIIFQRHLKGSLNNLIVNTNLDLITLRSKYLN